MIRLRGRVLLRCTALAALISVSSCAAPLLAPDEPRSQFDRYDTVRNQHAEQAMFDNNARRRPDLDARLTVKY